MLLNNELYCILDEEWILCALVFVKHASVCYKLHSFVCIILEVRYVLILHIPMSINSQTLSNIRMLPVRNNEVRAIVTFLGQLLLTHIDRDKHVIIILF